MNRKNAKIIITSKWHSIEEKVELEEKNDIYYFTLADASKNRFSKKELVLTRETKDAIFEMFFQEKEICMIDMKKEKLYLEIPLQVLKKEITEKEIAIFYKIEADEYCFCIVLEGDE